MTQRLLTTIIALWLMTGLVSAAPSKVAIIVVTHTSTTQAAGSPASMQAYLNNVGAFYSENSYGIRSWSTTDFYGYYFLHPEVACTTASDYQTLAAPDGYAVANYLFTVYFNPDCPSLGEGGAGYPYINHFDQHTPFWVGLVSLGVGNPEGPGLVCRDPVSGAFISYSTSNNCVLQNFLDLGITGGGDDLRNGHFPARIKNLVGWLTAANVQTVSSTGTYTLTPLEQPLGIEMLAINTPTGLPVFNLEYRQASPFEPKSRGFYLHTSGGPIIDATPDGLFGPNQGDSAIPLGKWFYDAIDQILITPVTETSTSGTVRVELGPQPCVRGTPTVVASPAQSIGPGNSATYSVTVTSTDSPSCAPTPVVVTATAAESSAPTPTNAPTSVTFLGTDTATQGNWTNLYSSGSVASDGSNLPSFASSSFTGGSTWSWAAITTDPRAPFIVGSTTRTAGCWYEATHDFRLNINLTDGQPHTVAIYMMDWDNQGRVQQVEVHDAASDAILDTRTVSNFSGGQYLKWTVTGHISVKLFVTSTNTSGAVVSGVFVQ